MIVSSRVFLILLAPLLLLGAPTPIPTNDVNRDSSGETRWLVDGLLPITRPATQSRNQSPAAGDGGGGQPPSIVHESEPVHALNGPPPPGQTTNTVTVPNRRRDHGLPPTNAVQFSDLTKDFINHRLVPKTVDLPRGSWYRVPSDKRHIYFEKPRTAIVTKSIAVTPQGYIVPLLPGTKVFLSDNIQVPDDTLRVIDIPEADRNQIWHDCWVHYQKQVEIGRRVFPLKRAQQESKYMQLCFDGNLWTYPEKFVAPDVTFLETGQKSVILPSER